MLICGIKIQVNDPNMKIVYWNVCITFNP